MTLEELYLKEKERIKKLSKRYAKKFRVEQEDLAQEGALAVLETYARYAYKLSDDELLKVSHKIINRKMYKYARNEYKYISRTISTEDNAAKEH
ncbi:MAG: hypothetical protein U9Q18_02465 [Caldisericota bacterium]|nr:hypothetical protein [Caldisericota bacterium]